MPHIKAIFSDSLAVSDEDYIQKRNTIGKEYTIYQKNRIVCPPCSSASLHAVSISRVFGILRYGDTLVEVEFVDSEGRLLPCGEYEVEPGHFSGKYQRVTRIFDMTTKEGIDEFFEYARLNNVDLVNEIQNICFPGHLQKTTFGEASFDYIYSLLGLPLPQDPYTIDKWRDEVNARKKAEMEMENYVMENKSENILNRMLQKIESFFKR